MNRVVIGVTICPPGSLVLTSLVREGNRAPLILRGRVERGVGSPRVSSPPVGVARRSPLGKLGCTTVRIPSNMHKEVSVVKPLVSSTRTTVIISNTPCNFKYVKYTEAGRLSVFLLEGGNVPILRLGCPSGRSRACIVIGTVGRFVSSLRRADRRRWW